MWEFITILTGVILLVSSSNVIRLGGASLVSISLVNWAGGFDYLQSLTNGVIYLQVLGMALYAMPLMIVHKNMPLSTKEWITVTCFFLLMALDGAYLINYMEELISLEGTLDYGINLFCFSILILANIRKGVQNGSLILSGAFRLFVGLCNNNLLCTKVSQLLAKQKGDIKISSQGNMEGQECQLKL